MALAGDADFGRSVSWTDAEENRSVVVRSHASGKCLGGCSVPSGSHYVLAGYFCNPLHAKFFPGNLALLREAFRAAAGRRVFLSARNHAQLYVRNREVSILLRATCSPGARLAKVGKELGIPVRELGDSVPVCMVAGLLRPCVVISSGALSQLEDWALRAALLHERAHIRNRDTLRSAAIAFVSDCAPFGTKKALALYRIGREILADREATRHVKGVELAAVLVNFARSGGQSPLTHPFAQPGGLEHRVKLLLQDPCAPARPATKPLPLLIYFASIAALGLYPLAAKAIDKLIFHCAP
jgi:hypothetical protein